MAASIRRETCTAPSITTDYRFPPPNQPCLALRSITSISRRRMSTCRTRGPSSPTRRCSAFRKPVLISEYGLHVSPNYFAMIRPACTCTMAWGPGVPSGRRGLGWWEDAWLRDLWYHHTGIALLRRTDLGVTSRLAATIDDDQLLAMATAVKADLGQQPAADPHRRRKSTQWWPPTASCAGGLPGANPPEPGAVFWDTFDGVVGSAP
jgi:hypothetical protein